MADLSIDTFCEKNNVAVVLQSSDYYTPYTGITIGSLIENTSAEYNYDINVMSLDMSPSNIQSLKLLAKGRKNVSIRVHNVAKYHEDIVFYTRIRFGTENWTRIMLPFIMQRYDKIIDLDCDICVNADVAELYNTELGDNYIAAARDINVPGSYARGEIFKGYIDDVLEMQSPHNYFQSGVTVMNMKKLREDFTLEYLLGLAQSNEYRFIDQDLLNVICEGRTVHLDFSWNYTPDTYNAVPWLIKEGHPGFVKEVLAAKEAPKIIHYAGHLKPWNCISMEYARKYWEYAAKTHFYEILAWRNNEEYIKNSLDYLERRGIKI